MKILIVEDDSSQAAILADFLQNHKFSVEIAEDGTQALNYIEIFPYDLIILDLMLPKLDGISLCKQLRQKKNQTPILVLTVQSSLNNKVEGLSSGADDYLVKPFEKEELLARIQSLLRRSHIPIRPDLTWENLHLSLNNSQVTYNESRLNLTRTEYGFLELFLRHPSQLFSAEQMINHQFASDHSYSIAAVRSHIKGLRHKLSQAGVPDLIETVYGLGYRLRTEPSTRLQPQTPDLSNPEKIAKTLERLARSREKFKPTILQQLDLIQTMSQQAVHTNSSDQEVKELIQQEVHQLKGLLGILGFSQGSKYCADIEALLNQQTQLNRDQTSQLKESIIAIRQVINLPVDQSPSNQSPSNPFLPSSPSNHPFDHPEKWPHLLIVDKDLPLATQIQHEASLWGFNAIAVSTPAATWFQLQKQKPDIILIDFDLQTNSDENIKFVKELMQAYPSIPTLIFTAQGSFSTRLAMSQLNTHAFLQKPMAPKQVMLEINRSFQQVCVNDVQILIVDDHPPVFQLLKQILEPYGIKVATLEDSRLLWQTLEKETPDLVILDVRMPHVNGIDLCQVVRQDPRWHELPILMLTAYSDPQTVEQVLAAGADDVVSKEVEQPELIARVMTRIRRTPLLSKALE